MKIIIGLVSIVLTGSIALSPLPKTVNGTWILQRGNYLYYPYVLRLKMDEGFVKGTIDIPTQHVYDMPLQSVILKNDSIYISMDNNKSVQINAVIRKKEINGVLLTGGKKNKVSFVKQ